MTQVDVYDATDAMKKSWWVLLLFGIVSILIGGVLIFWPEQTLTVVTTLVGLFMVIAGIVRFFMAIFASNVEHRWLLAIFGMIGVALGVIIMRNPTETIKIIVLITALFWIIGGMVDFFRGITDSTAPDRALRIGFGALSALFGVILLAWPDVTVTVFAILVGIYIVLLGILEIVASFQIKNA